MHMKYLEELQKIEQILETDNQQYLTSEVLCSIPFHGAELPVYAISMGNHSPDLPSMTFVGGVHGLERIGTQIILTFLEMLLTRLQWDITFADLLQRIKINFIPLVNPVGMLNHTRSNGNGIDLMRNAPVDSEEKTVWLGGGHRISPRLPWYRGEAEKTMQAEAQCLCDYVSKHLFQSPFSLVLDCHSGFGMHNQIWFPYAKSRRQAIKNIGEVYFLRQLFFQTYPHQNYRFEPQSQHYLTHGDLWDYLYDQSLANSNIFLPLTLEIGSWRWIRKNPLQLTQSLGFFHPMKPHRISRVLRGHLILMEFLVHASLSFEKWLNASHTDLMKEQAIELWYKNNDKPQTKQ